MRAARRTGRLLGCGDRPLHLLVGAGQRRVRGRARIDRRDLDPLPRSVDLVRDPGDLVHRGAEALEGLGDLRRHHPDLVGRALGDLRHHLEVLVGQQRLVRLPVVDGLEDRLDGLPLTLGLQDRRLAVGLGTQDQRLPVTLGRQDRCLLVALRGEDRGLPLTLGGQDDGALVAVGAHLLLHRVLDRGRRVDALDLDPADPDAPAPGRLVEDAGESPVDVLARRQGLLQRHATDDVAQGGHGELLDRGDVVRDLVGRRHRVGHLEVDDGVDRDHQVVLGDHRLRREGDDLLAHVDDVAHAVDERGHHVEARLQRRLVLAETLDDAGTCLRDDPDGLGQHQHHEHQQDQEHDQYGHRLCLSLDMTRVVTTRAGGCAARTPSHP